MPKPIVCVASRAPHHAEQQTEVPDPGGNERFLSRSRSRRPFVPKANQQVRREPHNLPTHKQQQQAIGDQHPEHRSRKQGEKAEKPGEVFVVVHVGHAVDKDEQANERHHHQHDGS
jgi:hypothetical protein